MYFVTHLNIVKVRLIYEQLCINSNIFDILSKKLYLYAYFSFCCYKDIFVRVEI